MWLITVCITLLKTEVIAPPPANEMNIPANAAAPTITNPYSAVDCPFSSRPKNLEFNFECNFLRF